MRECRDDSQFLQRLLHCQLASHFGQAFDGYFLALEATQEEKWITTWGPLHS